MSKNTPSHLFVRKRTLLLIIATVAAALMTLTVVLSQAINTNGVPYIGGDQLVCVDSGGNPTTDYPDLIGGGELRLVNSGGQVLFTITAEQIADALALAQQGNGSALVATGAGTFGTAILWVVDANAAPPVFEFTGVENAGPPPKLNTFRFTGCTPINREAQPEPDEETLCRLFEFYGETITFDRGEVEVEEVDCDVCPVVVTDETLLNDEEICVEQGEDLCVLTFESGIDVGEPYVFLPCDQCEGFVVFVSEGFGYCYALSPDLVAP